jgi:hypothetical protein
MTELIPTRRSQFIHSARSTRRKEGESFAFTCPWTAVRLSSPRSPAALRRRRMTAGEWGWRAGGTIELAETQRPLTLPRARAPLPRGGGGGVATIPASFQATFRGGGVATILATLKGVSTILATLKGGFAFGEGLHS